MEVVVPEFYLNISEPSSPRNHFTELNHHRRASAPNSPTASAAFYAAFHSTAAASRHSSVPFDWEEKPGTPKSPSFDENYNDFNFNFSFCIEAEGKSESFAAADELFDAGKIRPLKPPPRLCVIGEQGTKLPKSGGFLSPLRFGRSRPGKDLDPFVLAMVEATRSRRDECKEGSFFPSASSSFVMEKSGRGWKTRIKELILFRRLSESGGGKKRDFCKLGSLSSSSSGSSDSSSEKKIVETHRRTAFIFRSFNAGISFNRKRN